MMMMMMMMMPEFPDVRAVTLVLLQSCQRLVVNKRFEIFGTVTEMHFVLAIMTEALSAPDYG